MLKGPLYFFPEWDVNMLHSRKHTSCRLPAHGAETTSQMLQMLGVYRAARTHWNDWKIPKILHQTWKTDEIPVKYRALAGQLAKARPRPRWAVAVVFYSDSCGFLRWWNQLMAAAAPALALWILGWWPKCGFAVGPKRQRIGVFGKHIWYICFLPIFHGFLFLLGS